MESFLGVSKGLRILAARQQWNLHLRSAHLVYVTTRSPHFPFWHESDRDIS